MSCTPEYRWDGFEALPTHKRRGGKSCARADGSQSRSRSIRTTCVAANRPIGGHAIAVAKRGQASLAAEPCLLAIPASVAGEGGGTNSRPIPKNGTRTYTILVMGRPKGHRWLRE